MSQEKLRFRVDRCCNWNFISEEFENKINKEVKNYLSSRGISSEIIQSGDKGGGPDLNWLYTVLLFLSKTIKYLKSFYDGIFTKHLRNSAPGFKIQIYRTIDKNTELWSWETDIENDIKILLYHFWQIKKYLQTLYDEYQFWGEIDITIPSFMYNLNITVDKQYFTEPIIGELAYFVESSTIKSDIGEFLSISGKYFVRQLINKNNKAYNFYYFRGTKSRKFSNNFKNLVAKKSSKGVWISQKKSICQ